MHEIIPTAVRALVSVTLLFVLARIMGKKQIAQLSYFDYVISISIGSIAAESVVDPEIFMVEGFVGLIVFALFSIILSKLCMKSYLARKVLGGVPVVLVEKGKVITRGLEKTRMTVNDLLEECRQRNVFDLQDIAYAIMETSGQISVMLKSEKQPLTSGDVYIPTKPSGLCVNVIIDGKLIREHLQMLDKDEQWLGNELNKRGLKLSAVLLGCIDENGAFHLYRKYEEPEAKFIL